MARNLVDVLSICFNDIANLLYGTFHAFTPTTPIIDPYIVVKGVKTGTQKAGQYRDTLFPGAKADLTGFRTIGKFYPDGLTP